jgi:hypothetical protein
MIFHVAMNPVWRHAFLLLFTPLWNARVVCEVVQCSAKKSIFLISESVAVGLVGRDDSCDQAR